MLPEFWNEQNFNKVRDEEIAQQVVTRRCKNIAQVFTLHGEKSETKKKLNNYNNFFEEQEMYTKGGTTIVIEGKMEESYDLEGLNRNIVIFKTKIKHLVIRACDDTRIFLNGGTIAGVDIMYGSNVSLRTSKHNYVNIEESSLTKVTGEVDDNTLIHVTKSLDVFVNHKNLRTNPFMTKPLKMVYKNQENEDRLDIGELSVSPVAESANERWDSKLMLMGRALSDSE